MRILTRMLLALAAYITAFTGFRYLGIGDGGLFDWALLVVASLGAVLSLRPLPSAHAALVFLSMLVLGFLSAFVILYAVFGESL